MTFELLGIVGQLEADYLGRLLHRPLSLGVVLVVELPIISLCGEIGPVKVFTGTQITIIIIE